ncbi:hypothetical protein B4083_2751 [Bacillus cereus]|nr:hypothetical protein B4083_2751 [Bacillus cereus]
MNFFILDEHYKKAQSNGISRIRLQERVYRYDWDIERGTRIAQGVIAPVETSYFIEVGELSISERGVGGLGSTVMK